MTLENAMLNSTLYGATKAAGVVPTAPPVHDAISSLETYVSQLEEAYLNLERRLDPVSAQRPPSTPAGVSTCLPSCGTSPFTRAVVGITSRIVTLRDRIHDVLNILEI